MNDTNSMIAQFMGWKLVDRDGYECFVKDDYRRYHQDLVYHKDWNWLMDAWSCVYARMLEFSYRLTDLELENVFTIEVTFATACKLAIIEGAYQSVVAGIMLINTK